MTHNDYERLDLIAVETSNDNDDDDFSIPLCIDDIITICREYNSLGWQIQNQVEHILEVGVDEAIKSGHVKQESLPHIKCFLRKICANPYFGEARAQSQDCLELIRQYEDKYQIRYTTNFN